MNISKRLALEVLNTLLSTGADYAEIYYQDQIDHSYSRRYKKVNSVSLNRTSGAGLRILKGEETVYGYTSEISKKSLLLLAEKLASSLKGERIKSVTDLVKKRFKKLNKVETEHSEWSTDRKLDILLQAETLSFSYSPLVKEVYTCLFEEDEIIEVYNSDGYMFSDKRTRTRFMLSITSSDGEKFQNSFGSQGYSCGLEIFSSFDMEEFCRKYAKTAVDLLSAEDSPSGEMPVVLGNAFGGVLFHEACGHPMEGSAVAYNLSPFTGKLGEKIASEVVDAYDDGTIKNGWGTESIDDEGILPTRNQLIKKGVLVSYMLDRLTAKKMGEGFKPTGSCRRETYMDIPTTRMTNTFIGKGKSTKEEIISSVKDGIYCEDFSGGQVDPATDQFMFTSTTAYRIKDGKISSIIKPVTLTGYGYEIIKRITMVGNDLETSPGVCGASSGSVYVECGQPTLLVSKILVGGEGNQE